MNRKTTRILLLLLLMVSTQVAVAQSKPTYQYMQLFYYGTSTLAGPVGHFSPALRGQTDITLTAPTAQMKQVTAKLFGPGLGSGEMQYGVATTEDGTYVKGKKQTPAQLQQMQAKEQQAQEAALTEQLRMVSDHIKTVTEKVTQSLNMAVEDGWEVTQMSGFGTDGLVYLLRKTK